MELPEALLASSEIRGSILLASARIAVKKSKWEKRDNLISLCVCKGELVEENYFTCVTCT